MGKIPALCKRAERLGQRIRDSLVYVELLMYSSVLVSILSFR